jgi:MFS family permease
VLAEPALRRLLGGQTLFLLAFWSLTAPLSVLFFERGGPGLVAGAVVARQLPSALMAPLLGAIVDRVPRRTALVGSAAACAFSLAAVAAVVAAGAPAGVVVAVSVLAGVCASAFEPARHATLPLVAPDPRQLAAANIVGSGVHGSTIFAGPALGAAVLAAAGIDAAFVVPPVLMAGAIAVLVRLPGTHGATAAAAGDTDDEHTDDDGGVRAGFSAVWGMHDVRLLVLLAGAQLIVDGMLKVFLPVAAIELLGMGNPGLGLLISALGIGGFLGVGLALALAARRPLGSTNWVANVIYGVPIMFIAVAGEPAIALVLMAIAGVGSTLIDTSGATLLQRATPERLRGRVFGVLEGTILGGSALGAAVAPLMLDLLGRQGAIVAGGGFVVVCAMLALPRLRALDIAYPMTAPEVVELLRRQPFFAALAPGDLEALAGSADRRHVAAGDAIVTQGELAHEWFAMLDGTVAVSVDGREVRTQGAGESFGEIGVIHEVPRTATVVAVTDADLVAIDGQAFRDVLSGDGAGRDSALALASTRLAHAQPAGFVR